MKRIGEILVAHEWIEPAILQRALVKQRETGQRLCSLLVLGGALAADEASVALAEQHGVAAVLQRHIERRDRSLTSLISPALARACVALPIGRMGNGDLIVCVRDPSPALQTQLARAMKEPVRLAVAPAHQLEALVLETYGEDEANDFDVDLSTGPVMSLELDEEQIEAMSDDVMADLGSMELVDLDDTGVAKDASQTQIPIGNQRHSTLPPANVTADAPSYRGPAVSPLVDAPSYRSQTAIVVDAPSQRSALPPVARTRTEPPGRAALSAAGITLPRTQTQPPTALDAAPPAAPAAAIEEDDLAVIQSSRPDEPPAPSPPPAAPPPPEPAPVTAPLAARTPGTPVIPIPSIVAPPASVTRTRPAALAALERAAAVARTMTPPPREPAPPSAPLPEPPAMIADGTESQGAPVPEVIAVGTQLPIASLAVSARLAETLAALSAAATEDAVSDAVMGFSGKRWSAAFLLEIDDEAATGRRGWGAHLSDELAQWTVLSLSEPSLLRAAFVGTTVASATPDGHGDVEDRLQRSLGQPRAPSAIAILVEGKPALLLAVGDPDGDDLKTAAADLERLALGAGTALTRVRGR